MPKEKPPPEPPDDCPAWFMTYSDVITLLMTFFILLLTFATMEPEEFERIQSTVFSDGGASGLLVEAKSSVEKDSLVMRTRPRSSRLTRRGSENAPIHSDPANESLANGLESLKKEPEHDLQSTRSFEMSLSALVDDNDQVTDFGIAMAKKLAGHLRKGPFLVHLGVASSPDLSKAIAFGDALKIAARLPLGRIGIGVRTEAQANPTKMAIVLSRIWNSD